MQLNSYLSPPPTHAVPQRIAIYFLPVLLNPFFYFLYPSEPTFTEINKQFMKLAMDVQIIPVYKTNFRLKSECSLRKEHAT